ncbi:hypothetical protein [Blastococcus sp. Marseille-P5729]|uniref:hypothetical protein n=1 Tax=Blastococcus sp. Marseille-P5729 TaxID=2086582 RepID=UPI000D0FFF28|nr:hypothetical protein [Blastococcus sp. Marseille-P5729]
MSEAADDVRPTAQSDSEHAEQAATAAKRLGKFASAHGGAKHVYVEHVSANRSRIVVVADDGRYGDQVVDSHEAAMDACARAGFEVAEGEWGREAVGAVRTTAFEWGLMGKGRPGGS